MKKLWLVGLFVLSSVLGLPSTVLAQTPALINYQGRLLNGTNLVNGSVGLSLRLFNVSSGGTKIYEDSNSVTVADGLYSTFIGDHPTNNALLTAMTNAEVWVETAVNGTTLAPRERLAAVAYSLSTRGLLATTNGTVIHHPSANSAAASSDNSAIGGGDGNTIGANTGWGTIGGGQLNVLAVSADWATVGGGGFNEIQNVANYAVIAGGRENLIKTGSYYSAVGGGYANIINRDATGCTIGGGWGNTIASCVTNSGVLGGESNGIGGTSRWASIVGGYGNGVASNASAAVIMGGMLNHANAQFAMVPGGFQCYANGYAGFAGGWMARSLHTGAFVWADPSVSAFTDSTNGSSVTLRAAGGYRLFTDGNQLFGVQLPPFGTAWAVLSDRNRKENFEAIDTAEVLKKVRELPLTAWNYRQDPTRRRYIGPVAQDFHAAFGLGDDRTISTLDADGVALAAIQALAKDNAEFRVTNAELTERLEKLERELQAIRQEHSR